MTWPWPSKEDRRFWRVHRRALSRWFDGRGTHPYAAERRAMRSMARRAASIKGGRR